MAQPLVSIIIPTFNRAHLIGETLDSVLAQTYTNWECIVVDDGSTDNTDEVLKNYCEKDARFKYVHRPNTHKPGGNGARNYGFELSKGDYIQWFDSDDLMLPLFIQKKVELLNEENLDFVISHSVNFDNAGNDSPIFEKDNDGKEITAENFINSTINWITMDVMVSRQSIGDLRFNEVLKSGQEYNFYSRYLLNNPQGKFIIECLAKRRVHSNSIQGFQKLNKIDYHLNKYNVYLMTYLDIQNCEDVDKVKGIQLLNNAMSNAYELILYNETSPHLTLFIKSILKNKGVYKLTVFTLSLFCGFFFKKGYKIMNYSRR